MMMCYFRNRIRVDYRIRVDFREVVGLYLFYNFYFRY
jgi:hypothetical protein